MKSKYDIAVIGSGPGGFSAAVRAAQLGKSVVIIEKSSTGGTCLNRGCIPTKFLWQALKTKQKIQKSCEYGFKSVLEPFSFADIAAKKDKAVSNLRKGMEMILSSYNIPAIKGQASFKSQNVLEVSSENEKTEISAEKIIIASGSEPAALKNAVFDGKKFASSDDVLNFTAVPESVLIIGGGAIGVELAGILAGFGSRAALAEYESSLLSGEDSEICEEIKKSLQRQGVEVFTSCKNALELAEGYEKVLIATGRKPCGNLRLENAGVKTNQKGFIITNEFLQTNIENIYAAGDATGGNLLAYAAQRDGAAAAENAVKGNAASNRGGIVPKAVFSNPPAASVKTESFDNYKKEDLLFGKFSFASSGRAFIECERTGFIKCAVDKNTKKPLGFWIFGAHSDEIINAAAQILKNGEAPARENFFHPSLTEGLFNAYEDAFKLSIETIKK